ncbi:MAG: hypothetical protein HC809_06930 [Gammaproteobacteria bacterium]|nr:hypothetical protein [Gammaproteobacteria bacterium]
MRSVVDWALSKGPVGFWLALGALLAFCPFPYLDAELFGVAQFFALLLLIACLAVTVLAVRHHERGWEAVRLLSFVGSTVWGTLFVTHLLLLTPEGTAVAGVVSLGVATAAWIAVFQYFRQEAIQQLFPYRAQERPYRRR